MKTKFILVLVSLSLCGSLLAGGRQPVDYVNTGIGSISHMLVPTFRTVQLPNALYRFNAPDGQVTEDRISAFWLQNPAHRDQPVFSLGPMSGVESPLAADWSSTWDQCHATPYRYDVWLDTWGVTFSLAPARQAAIAHLTFERDGSHVLVFGCRDARGSYEFKDGILYGRDIFHGRPSCEAPVYLAVAFETAPQRVQTNEAGNRIALTFGNRANETVRLRLGISYLSYAHALSHAQRELPDFDLAALAARGHEIWNDRLSVIEVEGGTEDEKAVFYTALWRTFERMVDITEDGHYLGVDGCEHDAEGRTYYTDDWVWDTWRAAHPLMTILCPREENDKLLSYIRMAEADCEHWMPVFPGVAGDRHSMVNRHISVTFLDAWRKGIRDYDARKAFDFIDHTEETESMIPWYRGPLTELDRFYQEKGYYPGLRTNETETCSAVDTRWERRQCVSVTQGAALDAWAIAAWGRELGIEESRLAKYDARAKGVRQLWNRQTQFFQPKDAQGAFIEPFDPVRCGGYGARNYYTENNAWTYIWDMQQDLPGLVELFGGQAAMEAKLDEMLNTQVDNRYQYTADMPDGCTGIMGMFTMANEPAFHIPYLYNYVGRPDKTQKFVRKTLDCWFRNDRMGMCGDEDGGGMSAYAVFSMLGFYPVTPGIAEYQIGSPVFTKVTIHQQNGRDFVLSAPKASADAKYVTRVILGGRPLVGTAFPHAAIVAGEQLVCEMSERPPAHP